MEKNNREHKKKEKTRVLSLSRQPAFRLPADGQVSDPIHPEISLQSPVFLLNSRRPFLFAELIHLASPENRLRGGTPLSRA